MPNTLGDIKEVTKESSIVTDEEILSEYLRPILDQINDEDLKCVVNFWFNGSDLGDLALNNDAVDKIHIIKDIMSCEFLQLPLNRDRNDQDKIKSLLCLEQCDRQNALKFVLSSLKKNLPEIDQEKLYESSLKELPIIIEAGNNEEAPNQERCTPRTLSSKSAFLVSSATTLPLMLSSIFRTIAGCSAETDTELGLNLTKGLWAIASCIHLHRAQSKLLQSTKLKLEDKMFALAVVSAIVLAPVISSSNNDSIDGDDYISYSKLLLESCAAYYGGAYSIMKAVNAASNLWQRNRDPESTGPRSLVNGPLAIASLNNSRRVAIP